MMKKKKLWLIIPFVLIAAAVIFLIRHITMKLSIGRYTVDTDEDPDITIAQISDLHSCRYGKDMQELVSAVDSLSPDIVCLTGDIFDDDLPNENSLTFLAAIAAKYPCYYVTGNHEHRRDPDELEDLLARMEEMGIHLLRNRYEIAEVRGQKVCLAGIWGDERESFAYSFLKELPSDLYTVLLCHYPEFTGAYRTSGIDLILSGHAHGGQWRLRSDGEGLIAPGQGLFPKYSGGLYELGDETTLIVSRGLARESHYVPRLNNAPEVLEIKLK